MFKNLFDKLRRVERVASVAPYVKKTPEISHDAPVMSKKPPIVDVSPIMQPPVPPKGFDKAAFFARLREGPLRHRTPEQVKGTEHILEACEGLPISWAAYALATAYHETGGDMSPNVESLNYTVAGLLNTFGRHRISRADAERLGRKPGEPALSITRQRAIGNILYGGTWGRDNLGNTEPDDGWTYRGRGMAHDTGRRNYDLSGKAVGVDLLSQPHDLLRADIAAKVMVSGMKSGRYTGRAFVHFLPSKGEATANQFGQARRIINGTDKMGEVAAHALTFQRALKAGGRA